MNAWVFRVTGLIVVAAILGSVVARAEEEGALGIKMGAGNRLLLGLETDAAYYSNFYYTPSNEESAVGLIVKPGVVFSSDRGDFRYLLGAAAAAGAFDLNGDKDDYLDTNLGGSFEWNPLTRHSLKGSATRVDDHDSFGTRRTEGTAAASADLDEWTKTGANLVYRFGAPQAKLNFEAEALTLDKEYTTNRSTTRFLDYEADGLRGAVFYNLSSKTALLAEVITGDVDYDEVAPGFASRSGDITRYRIGAQWFATGKTEADVRIGRLERDFDSSLRQSFSGTDWKIGVTWSPRARDVLRLTTGREPEESYINAAGFIDNQFVTLSWSHDWTALLKTKVGYAYDEFDFYDVTREDTIEKLTLGAEYQAARRWSVFGDLKFEQRDSNAANRDYDNTVFMTGIRLNY